MNFDGSSLDEAEQRRLVRRSIIDQLSFDPMTGVQRSLPGDSIQLLAWGTDPVVPAEIEGQQVRRVGQHAVRGPAPVHGRRQRRRSPATCCAASVVDIDADFFSRDPWSISSAPGDARIACRPLPFDGTFDADEGRRRAGLRAATSRLPGGTRRALKESPGAIPRHAPTACPPRTGCPDIEVLDVAHRRLGPVRRT